LKFNCAAVRRVTVSWISLESTLGLSAGNEEAAAV